MIQASKHYKQAYKELSSGEKKQFLAFLTFHVSEMARGNYPEAREGNTSATNSLIVINEMMHLISKQLLATSGVLTYAYLNDVFFDELLDYAEKGNCKTGTIWAADTALKDMIGIIGNRQLPSET